MAEMKKWQRAQHGSNFLQQINNLAYIDELTGPRGCNRVAMEMYKAPHPLILAQGWHVFQSAMTLRTDS